MAVIIKGIADQQNSVPGFMFAKLLDSLMQSVIERDMLTQSAGFLNHAVDFSGAFFFIRAEMFGKDGMIGVDAEGDGLSVLGLARQLGNGFYLVIELFI